MAVSTQVSVVESVSSVLSSEEEDYNDYYYDDLDDQDDTGDGAPQDASFQSDPEHYSFLCLSTEETWNYLDSTARDTGRLIKVEAPSARALLHHLHWDSDLLVENYTTDRRGVLDDANVLPPDPSPSQLTMVSACPVCLVPSSEATLASLACGHMFCTGCWGDYVRTQIQEGVASGLECMQCPVKVTMETVQSFIQGSTPLYLRYRELCLSEFVLSHSLLRWCPGPDCSVVFQVDVVQAKKVECPKCNTSCCFRCGTDYHLPSNCEDMKKWTQKCSDDSETANYILANTKDCPKCRTAIEKNGGCNHMRCTRCNFDFCWMCMKEWKNHTGYFECNKYKAGSSEAHNQARQLLEKYLFYYQRWANHVESLRLEEETTRRIKGRIGDKIADGFGTWIDWQYLLDAASLLRKCRYTLKYTYPYAYYSEDDRKPLFEYQQARLEVEIENLSWKVERAESTDVADIRQQMNITEVQRLTLLRDFVP